MRDGSIRARGRAPREVWLLVAFASVLDLMGCESGGETPLTSRPPAPILLFDGPGTSENDVAAIEALLEREGLGYSTASSDELHAMSASQLRAHRLLIVPGGDFVAMGNGLRASTLEEIRLAVHDGLGYLGICAGAFLAGHFPAPYRSIDLTSGVRFRFYAASARGIRKAAVEITRPGDPALDQYWEDGPELSGWGEVIGTYPDGTAAIVQGTSGRGRVILSGVHAEAPASWREGLTFRTTVEVDNAYAVTLIRAALDRTSLPTF